MVSPTDHRVPGPGGLEAVYLAQRDALVRFLRARGAAHDAEDVVQELWVKVSATASAPIGDPVSYLYRAANNLMISRYRSAQRSERRDGEWSGGIEETAESTETTVAARQEIARAERLLRDLGQRVLQVFVMFRVEGVSQGNIAAQLGISISAVEKDLQRAYRAIAGFRSEIDAE